ncbi:D-alanyl-D-alanine carboxypeptidase [Streptomyces lincolnensis]|uniref:serine-type D-Ala-D-Ala carboxypeptidase n=2 Tax=Streptomyces lincolnensis TaxID=1915 RepID=A0A1B1MBX9_STRLN|nr:D-alanyl-D-alanine carboxypeptidase [Streptomyces lincolnensis]ANS65912.1 D-alanyl-D-alanine carboxypeptidase [Streptomyces lincolnensis]AXG54325.1 D-alanyl-D-alanine carboxypeptidase [Streptomyces lincolnensis]
MAGESPDRSKQHGSSAEPTSGSAAPVPEARTGTNAPRDPRLAMTRIGGVDTATKVFSVREVADTGEAEGDLPKGDSAEARGEDAERGADTAEADAGSDASGDESTTTGDDRLRDAVAAWVAKADDKAAGAVENAQDAEEGSPGAQDATEASSGEQDPVEPAQGESGSAAGAKDAKTSTETTETPDDHTEDDPEPAADAASEDDTDEDLGDRADADAEAGDEAAAAEGSGEDSDESAGDTAEAGAGDEATAHEAPDDRSDAEAEQQDEPEAVADREDAGADEPEDQEPVKADASAEAAAEAGSESDSEAGADDEADADAESGTAAEDGTSETPASPDAEDADAAVAASDDDGTPDATSSPDADGPDASPEADGAATAASDDDGTPDAKAADAKSPDSPDTDTDADADADDKPAVDQPTAVFKAPRVTGPAVDQPTTMLKLGGAAKAGEGKSGADDKPDADAKSDADANASDKAPAQPEREAERTSRFVALKPLDDPATRKPPAADATTAFPRVSGRPDATTALPQVKGRPDATAAVPQVGPERTTQQPLPPKPPLDLLAELTNTPPPPDTPVRTAVRRVKIWTPLVLLLAVVFAVVQSVRPLPAPELQLTAEDGFTFDGGKVDIPWPADGQAALDVQGIGTFGSSGEQKPVPIASVAKVMTAYVILRDHPLKSGADGPKIKIDQAAEDQSNAGQESTVDVTAGDSISQREALESILIASANNVARLLARWDAGSEKAFVEKMNDAAADLGMKNTTYTDPSGLNNTTVSTAVDQVKLGKKAMEEPAFREVAAMMSYIDYKGTKHDNWNRLVGYNNVVGIKTGTTTSALGNLVFAAKKDVNGETRRIVGAVVRQPAGGDDNTILGAALFESDKLIRAAQDALRSETILKKGDVVGYVDDGLGGHTPVVLTKNVTAVGWAGLTVKLTFTADDLPHTAKAGAQVGSLTVGDGSGSAVKVPVALQDDLVEPGFTDKLTRLG